MDAVMLRRSHYLMHEVGNWTVHCLKLLYWAFLPCSLGKASHYVAMPVHRATRHQGELPIIGSYGIRNIRLLSLAQRPKALLFFLVSNIRFGRKADQCLSAVGMAAEILANEVFHLIFRLVCYKSCTHCIMPSGFV